MVATLAGLLMARPFRWPKTMLALTGACWRGSTGLVPAGADLTRRSRRCSRSLSAAAAACRREAVNRSRRRARGHRGVLLARITVVLPY
jgi:hypothetical protein